MTINRNKRGKLMITRKRDWAQGLPYGLIETIVESLSFSDSISFAKVCKSWQSVAIQVNSPACPCLVTENTLKILTFDCITTELKPQKINFMCDFILFGSYRDWIIMKSPMRFKLWNPFTGHEIFSPEVNSPSDETGKMLLSTSPSDETCIYMLMYRSKLAFWTTGVQTWAEIPGHYKDKLVDAAFCDGYFYILTQSYNIHRLHASCLFKKNGSPCTAELKTDSYTLQLPFVGHDPVVNYLLESHGSILLVIRFLTSTYQARTLHFRIYRLDTSKMAWVKSDDLGDEIIFLGITSSVSYPANKLGIDKANHIFFTNDYRYFGYQTSLKASGFGTQDSGTFNFETKSLRRFKFSYDAIDQSKHPVWISAPLWWYVSREHEIHPPTRILADTLSSTIMVCC